MTINGIVQGVGFRPFIYGLARRYGLTGEVANTATGVSLLLEGPADQIQSFIDDLPRRKPPLAQIVEISTDAGKPLSRIHRLFHCQKPGQALPGPPSSRRM